jgi:hypothetical protein
MVNGPTFSHNMAKRMDLLFYIRPVWSVSSSIFGGDSLGVKWIRLERFPVF